MKKYLRITGCSDASYWYSDKIGDVKEYLSVDGDEYVTWEDAGFINIIKTKDAELLTEQEIKDYGS